MIHFLCFTLQNYKKAIEFANVLIVLFCFAYQERHLYFCIEDDWIENCYYEKCSRYGYVPLVTDASVNVKDMLECEVKNSNNGIVQSDDDQCADGEIGNDAGLYGGECFATIEKCEEETYIHGIEDGYVQKEDVFVQVPLKEDETEDE